MTDERLLPTEQVATAGTEFDLTEGIVASHANFDHSFTDLVRDADGLAHTCIFTPDDYIGGVKAIAVEPQTSAANAFNTGQDLTLLECGKVWRASWGIAIKKCDFVHLALT